jgi:hypothetical protein
MGIVVTITQRKYSTHPGRRRLHPPRSSATAQTPTPHWSGHALLSVTVRDNLLRTAADHEARAGTN